MKLLIVLAALFLVAYTSSVEEEWQLFKINYGKAYKSLLEEKRRFAVFQANFRKIERHNEKFANGESAFKMGITKFADLDEEEFKSVTTLQKFEIPQSIVLQTYIPKGSKVNKTINYVSDGLVTEVKDQKSCGACWAFSVVGAIEGQVAKEKKVLKSLSPQQLIDCDGYDDGCRGGLSLRAYHWIMENGILDDDDYPFIGVHDKGCLKTGGLTISGIVQVQPKDDELLLEALATAGPITSEMNSNDLQFYKEGILDERGSCSQGNNDHAVLIVGAATENDVDYFLVKNSYGKEWGLDGYFKIKRQGNVCGILEFNLYPIL